MHYLKVEWQPGTTSTGERDDEHGYIKDAEADLEVMPWELVARYNDLVDELATLRGQRTVVIESLKCIGVYVKQAEIAVGRNVLGERPN